MKSKFIIWISTSQKNDLIRNLFLVSSFFSFQDELCCFLINKNCFEKKIVYFRLFGVAKFQYSSRVIIKRKPLEPPAMVRHMRIFFKRNTRCMCHSDRYENSEIFEKKEREKIAVVKLIGTCAMRVDASNKSIETNQFYFSIVHQT